MSLPVPLYACPGHLICAVLRSQGATVTRGCARPAGRLVAVSCCFQEPSGQRCCFPSPPTGLLLLFLPFCVHYISSFLLSVFLSFRNLILQSPPSFFPMSWLHPFALVPERSASWRSVCEPGQRGILLGEEWITAVLGFHVLRREDPKF